MAEVSLSAEIQGADADLSTATGSYDAVSLGRFGPDRLAEFLAAMTMLTPPAGDDPCWPNLTVHGPGGDHSFTLADGEGTLVDGDGEKVADIGAAVETVCGQAFTGVVPAHRRGAGSAPAPASPAVAGGDGPPTVLDAPAKALLELLENPLRLAEVRRRFPHVLAGESDPEWRRLVAVLEGASGVAPELKTRLRHMPPRDWALRRPGLFRRFLSLLVDLPCWFVLVFVGVAVLQAISPSDAKSMSTAQAFLIVGWLVLSVFLYFVGLEWLFSASPGGLLTGLRVVDERGRRPGLWLVVKRQLLRFFRLGAVLGLASLGSRQDSFHGMRTGRKAGHIAIGGGDEIVLS